jgi:peptidoglycan/LPS O-acetylase OafA/YrhL
MKKIADTTSHKHIHPSGYRADIDGLRGVAVLGVLFFHAGLGTSGGFAGVDIFFVISGFLITRIIFNELQQDKFSFLRFWERRARRILPALIVTIAATLLAGYFLSFPQAYVDLANSVVSVVLLCSNVFYWLGDDYFSTASESKPLLHTWSLAVEEQFYLVMPIITWLLYRVSRGRWIARTFLLAFIASFALSIWTLAQVHLVSATFYLLPTRAWELLAGSLLVFLPAIRSELLRITSAVSGIGMIAATYFLYSQATLFPGLAALPPVAGAFLLIWSGDSGGNPQTRVHKLLSAKSLVFVGLISYSLYLIHWPIFAFHHELFGKAPETSLALLLILIATLLAVASWRFVETPFRCQKILKNRPQVFVSSAIAASAMLLAGLFISKNAGIESRYNKDVLKIVTGESKSRTLPGRNMRIADIPDGLLRIGDKTGVAKVFLWGDSHADAVMPGVDKACRNLQVGGLAATAWVTPPLKTWYKPNRHGQNELTPAYNSAVFREINDLATNDLKPIVVLAGNWNYYLEEESDRSPFADAIHQQVSELVSIGCRVLILRQFPLYKDHVPSYLARNLHSGQRRFDIRMTEEQYRYQRSHQDKIFDLLGKSFPEVGFIDPFDEYLGDDGYMLLSNSDGYCLYRDNGHVSPSGAIQIAARIEEAIKAISN